MTALRYMVRAIPARLTRTRRYKTKFYVTPRPTWMILLSRLIPVLLVIGFLMTTRDRWLGHWKRSLLKSTRPPRRFPGRHYAGSQAVWIMRILLVEHGIITTRPPPSRQR